MKLRKRQLTHSVYHMIKLHLKIYIILCLDGVISFCVIYQMQQGMYINQINSQPLFRKRQRKA